MEFIISSHMLYAWSKAALNYCIRKVGVGKPQCGSMEALSSIEILLKPFAHQTNVTSSEKSTGVEGTWTSSKRGMYIIYN